MKAAPILAAAALIALAACTGVGDLDGIVAGPEYLTGEIAPIKAPFAMPELTKPVFPELSVDVALDSSSMNTEVIQSAIDFVSAAGGGTVELPKGKWPTGRLELKSGVNLHLSAGCDLRFSGEIKDYLPVVYTRDEGVNVYSLGACIYANGASRIALTGEGKITGPTTDCEIFRRMSEVSLRIDALPADVSAEERVFDGADGGMVYMPKTFAPINCTDVLVEGVTLDRGLYWNIVPQYCDRVIIRGVTVTSYGHSRTDGVDVDSSKDVLIEYCSFDCKDDCYTIKSGRGKDGVRTARPTENVVIRNCVALRGSGGLVCGSETAGGIRNIYMTDCIFDGTNIAFRLKTRRNRGGTVENITAERVRANVTKVGLSVDMRGSSYWMGELADRHPARKTDSLTPEYRNVTIHDVEVKVDDVFADIRALPERPLDGLKLYNVRARSARLGLIEDACNVEFRDVSVATQDSLFTLDNVLRASFKHFTNSLTDKEIDIR